MGTVSTQHVTTPATRPRRDPAKRVLPANPVRAAVVMGSFLALLYVVELVDALAFGGHLAQYGIDSRDVMGLPAIVWAPLIHVSWAHLFSNTVSLAVFGFLAMSAGIRPWIASTALIWLVSGLGVWLVGPSGAHGHAVTVGASGIAFGWLLFLLVRGLFNRSAGQILIAVVLMFFWGGILFGLLPGNPMVSWQGHLFGALGGVLAAWLATRANRTGRNSGKVEPSQGATGQLPFTPPTR